MDAGCFADGSTGWGCVTKDREGRVILAASRKEVTTIDPLLAEALGVRWGLQLAMEQQLEEVIILTDVLMVVNCINGKSFIATIDLVIEDCKVLMNVIGSVSVSHIGRQLNMEAYNSVGIAKAVGSKSWLGHVPSLDSVSCCIPSVSFG